MAFARRIKLIERIEAQRQSKVICYLTSVRPNFHAAMSDDVVRVFIEQMLLLPPRPIEKLDIFLCSNGGSGTVPWRLISLFREHAKKVGVLLPFRAYSAATLLAIGADEIVMHPFAEMGPIDPTVQNAYNPVDPQTNQRLGISVEDVKAYIAFIKDTAGIQHEEELVKAIEILAQKVHPLALGNVERFISQSRMIAGKLLGTHMDGEKQKHVIDEIIESLVSKFYFHGHPISRKEARDELRLPVVDPTPQLEMLMWKLYEDFEQDLKNREGFDPVGEILRQAPAPTAHPPLQGPQPVMIPSIIPTGTNASLDVTVAMVESARLSSEYKQSFRFVVAAASGDGSPVVRSEILAQGWADSPAPQRPQSKPRKRGHP